jgi:hypothetical protein
MPSWLLKQHMEYGINAALWHITVTHAATLHAVDTCIQLPYLDRYMAACCGSQLRMHLS